MKTIIKGMLLSSVVLSGLTACNDNSWNDHLDGFEKNPAYTDVQSLDYTLTDDDYNRVAKNRFNVAKATAAGVEKELASVGTQHYFNSAINPMEYIPNLLTDSLFRYYTLTEGSAINLTYKVAVNAPEELAKINAAREYVITDEDYQDAYGSENDYAATFSPSTSAAKNIPAILKEHYDDALEGDYIVVNYNNSIIDPVFNQPSTPDVPGFAVSNVIGSASVGDNLDINGIVTAKCVRGFILTDNSGSILVYTGNFDYDSVEIGDQLVVSAEITSYGNGLQIAYDSAEIEKKGSESYTYPSPVALTPAYLSAAAANTTPVTAVYGEMTGTVNISGNYINIILDTDQVRGSVYYAADDVKGQLADGEKVTLFGYFTATSGKSTPYNCNIVVTRVEKGGKSAKRSARRVVALASTNTNAVYRFDGSAWKVASNVAVLQPSDYTAMGQTYGNLSGEGPATYLPGYLKTTFPYAQAEDQKYVMYKYYASSVTAYRADLYTYSGSAWTLNDFIEDETAQYVYGPDGWVMDPSITVTLPAGRNEPLSTLFYQTCVDWVRDNVPDGAAYVTSYGNNEYYCGTSAYQGNIDHRASAAKTQYSGYDSISDDEIVALMKERFEKEVMPGALSVLYPNMDVTPGVDTMFTINFSVYTGSTAEYTIVFKVVGKGKFEFVSCTWNS